MHVGHESDSQGERIERHIAVLNDLRKEIARVPVYSKPSMSIT